MKKIKISIVSSHDVNENDFIVRGVFEKMIDEMKKLFKDFPYQKADFINFSFNNEPEQISHDSIVTINPVKYLICKRELYDNIIPVFAIQKVFQENPYFPAFFIANKNSKIQSIRDKEIKTLYAVSKYSASGFIAPIYKLWESGIIESPNEIGVEKKGWKLVKLGTHKEVEERVLDDEFSIGATGQFTNQEDLKNSIVKVLLRYYYLPQDVLAISGDMQPYKEFIEYWLKSFFITNRDANKDLITAFFNSSCRVTGIYEIDSEFRNALHELEIMTNFVVDFEKQKQYNKSKNNNNDDLLISVNLKKMLAKNKTDEVIDALIDHFTIINNRDAVNEAIMHSASNHAIQKQESLSIVDFDDLNRRKAQLSNSLLNLIDRELLRI